MANVVLCFSGGEAEGSCGLCGRPQSERGGLRLCLAGSLQDVCRECGRAHAPALAALLDVALEAEKAGRVSRHRRLWVPQEMLLALLGACEDYAGVVEAGRRGG